MRDGSGDVPAAPLRRSNRKRWKSGRLYGSEPAAPASGHVARGVEGSGKDRDKEMFTSMYLRCVQEACESWEVGLVDAI